MGSPAIAAAVAHRPSFDMLVANYPDPRKLGVVALKQLIGGGADDTKPNASHWLGGANGDTCTLRMSRALNRAGFPIPAHSPSLRTVRGKDGFNYAFAVQELHVWLKSRFGAPEILVKGKPVKRDQFDNKKGIIVFDIVFGLNPDGVTRAMGHADLWDGQTFFDELEGISNPQRDFFNVADAVSLWICPGTALLPLV
jgi:hypothetical protein